MTSPDNFKSVIWFKDILWGKWIYITNDIGKISYMKSEIYWIWHRHRVWYGKIFCEERTYICHIISVIYSLINQKYILYDIDRECDTERYFVRSGNISCGCVGEDFLFYPFVICHIWLQTAAQIINPLLFEIICAIDSHLRETFNIWTSDSFQYTTKATWLGSYSDYICCYDLFIYFKRDYALQNSHFMVASSIIMKNAPSFFIFKGIN